MKQLFLIFTLLQFIASASDSSKLFRNIPYSKLFSAAKKEKKAVMLYFHFEGCGACEDLDEYTLPNPELIKFYTTNFICKDVDVTTTEGKAIKKRYQQTVCPAVMYFDENGKELHKIVGVFSSYDFIAKAKLALNPKENLAFYKDKYKKGNRDPEFLFDLTYRLRDAYELDSLLINEYLNTQTLSNLETEKNIRYLYEFCLHQFQTTVNSTGFQFMMNNREKFYPYFEKEQVEVRLLWNIWSAIEDAIKKQNEKQFNMACDLLSTFEIDKDYYFKEVDGTKSGVFFYTKYALLEFKLDYLEKGNNLEKYYALLNIYLGKIWDDSIKLNSFAWNCYEYSTKPEKLQKALDCSKRSVELNDNYNNNHTLAYLFYKTGDRKMAVETLNKANRLAIVENQVESDSSGVAK